MAVEIPKGTMNEPETPGPCWIPCQTSDGKPAKPVIRCKCGSYCGIGLHHVHADGTVTASFLHGKAPFTHNGKSYPGDPNGCEWHEHIKLMNYDIGDFPSEE